MPIFRATSILGTHLEKHAELGDVASTSGSGSSTVSESDASCENQEGFWQEKSPSQETWFTNASISQYPAEKSAINRPVNRSIIDRYIGNFSAIFTTWE